MQSQSHPSATNRSTMLDNSRKRLLERTKGVGDPLFQVPHKPRVAASRQASLTKTSKKRKTKPETSAIRRDSKQHLNIACDGKFYEKAKSRRVRQRVALQQSGDKEEAVALGKTKNRNATSSKSFDVQDLEKQFEQKSFARRAKIAHGLQQMQREETKEPMKKKRRTKAQTNQNAIVKKSESNRGAVIPPTKKMTKARTQGQRPAQKHMGSKRIRTTVKEEPCPEVIDLISDSETDGDDEESDVIQALTQLLQTEAIGHGATHKEMKVYAQHLNALGLHSREMILRALDFDSDASNASQMEAKTAAQVVNGWKWMKPFHKTVFTRWIWRQQRR